MKNAEKTVKYDIMMLMKNRCENYNRFWQFWNFSDVLVLTYISQYHDVILEKYLCCAIHPGFVHVHEISK